MSKVTKRARLREVIGLMRERFPNAFNAGKQRRPLKLNIHTDVLAALDGEVGERELKSALRAYTSSGSYLRSVIAGAPRFGIDGQPAGSVTPQEAAHAEARLASARLARVPAHKDSLGTSIAKTAEMGNPPVVPAAKRLSLADLREAGRQRAAAAAKSAALGR